MLFIYYKDIIIISQHKKGINFGHWKWLPSCHRKRKSRAAKRERIGNGSRNTKSVHNKWLHAWMGSASSPPFFSLHPFSWQPANITIYVAKVQHFSRQSLSTQLECFRWRFCDEINMLRHRTTQTNQIFSNAPPVREPKRNKITMNLRCSIRVYTYRGINVPSRMVFPRVLCTLYAMAFTAHFLQTPIFMAYIK